MAVEIVLGFSIFVRISISGFSESRKCCKVVVSIRLIRVSTSFAFSASLFSIWDFARLIAASTLSAKVETVSLACIFSFLMLLSNRAVFEVSLNLTRKSFINASTS